MIAVAPHNAGPASDLLQESFRRGGGHRPTSDLPELEVEFFRLWVISRRRGRQRGVPETAAQPTCRDNYGSLDGLGAAFFSYAVIAALYLMTLGWTRFVCVASDGQRL